MPGFPGPLGFTAFAAVKFGGYMLAGLALKKFYPVIRDATWKIAGSRLLLGIFVGLAVFFAGVSIANAFPRLSDNVSPYAVYAGLVFLRIIVWSLIIRIFAGSQSSQPGKWLGLSAAGAAWSTLLDVPAIALAIVSPGAVPIC